MFGPRGFVTDSESSSRLLASGSGSVLDIRGAGAFGSGSGRFGSDPDLLRDDLRESSVLLIKPNKVGTAGVLSCTINLLNTILGAGILGLPYAFTQCGIVLGISLFGVAGALSATGLHLLSCCARAVPDGSFNVMADLTVPYLKIITDIAVALKCFGVGTSYMIVIGDVMPAACKTLLCGTETCQLTGVSNVLLSRQAWIVFFALAFVSRLVCLKKLDSLRITSLFSLLAMVYISAMIVAYAWVPDLDPCHGREAGCRGSIELGIPSEPLALLKVIPIFIFGYTCHQNTFTLVNELHKPTQQRCNSFVGLAIGVAVFFYCVVAASGYHTYGSKVPSNIIEAFPLTKFLAVGRIGLAFNMAFSYPLQCHPCRNSLSMLIFGEPAHCLEDGKYYLLTFGILVSSVGITMKVTNLGVVLALVGATGSTTISYILPGLFYAQYFDDWHPKRVVALCMVVLGCMLMPVMVALCFM